MKVYWNCLSALVKGLSGALILGWIPSRWEVVTTDVSLSGSGVVWHHRVVEVLELRLVLLSPNFFLPLLEPRDDLDRADTSSVFQTQHRGRSLQPS